MKKENIKKCIMVLFILYCLVLIYVLFLHNVYRYEYGDIGINNMLSEEHLQMINIIPFKTIIRYVQRLANHTINTDIVVRNIMIN